MSEYQCEVCGLDYEELTLDEYNKLEVDLIKGEDGKEIVVCGDCFCSVCGGLPKDIMHDGYDVDLVEVQDKVICTECIETTCVEKEDINNNNK